MSRKPTTFTCTEVTVADEQAIDADEVIRLLVGMALDTARAEVPTQRAVERDAIRAGRKVVISDCRTIPLYMRGMLEEWGCFTLGDLATLCPDDLMEIPNTTKATILAITDLLAANHLSLRANTDADV